MLAATSCRSIYWAMSTEHLTGHLKAIEGTPPLRRMNGFGFGLYGWLNEPSIEPAFIKLYFFSAFWLPIVPLCGYVVARQGDGFRFYGNMSLYSICRVYGWRVCTLYLKALIEGAGWLIAFGSIILLVAGAMHWLRNQF